LKNGTDNEAWIHQQLKHTAQTLAASASQHQQFAKDAGTAVAQ
jgi:hypothetical protein